MLNDKNKYYIEKIKHYEHHFNPDKLTKYIGKFSQNNKIGGDSNNDFIYEVLKILY